MSQSESGLQARVRRAGVQLAADTAISSMKQEKVSVKWRKTPEERKYDVIDIVNTGINVFRFSQLLDHRANLIWLLCTCCTLSLEITHSFFPLK